MSEDTIAGSTSGRLGDDRGFKSWRRPTSALTPYPGDPQGGLTERDERDGSLSDLVKLIKAQVRGPHQALGERPLFALPTTLTIHCWHLQWNLHGPKMEAKLHKRQFSWHFTALEGTARMPYETIPSFRHLLEKYELVPKILEAVDAGITQQGYSPRTSTVTDTTIIEPARSTKNKTIPRDPNMYQTAR
jgi:transposase, IS5 family